MSDSDRSNIEREVKIRIVKSEKYPEGGMAYINTIRKRYRYQYDYCSEIERADDREGSMALEKYLNDNLSFFAQNLYRCRISFVQGNFSRRLANLAFDTELKILSEEPTEETIEHPSFGTVLVKGLALE